MVVDARFLAAIAIIVVTAAPHAFAAAENTGTLRPLILAQGNSASPPQAGSPAAPSAFAAGLADRRAIEQWFASLTGDFKTGASYWAGQRNSPNPGSCYASDGSSTGSWTQGCLAAQRAFASTDIRRKAEPEYWRGWNSFAGLEEIPKPASSVAPPAATEKAPPPALAPTASTAKANTVTAANASRVSVLNGTFAGSYGTATTEEMKNLTLSDFAIAIAVDPFINDLDITFVAKITNNSEQKWKVGLCIRYYDSRNLQVDDSSGDRVNIGPDQSEMSNGTTYLPPKLWPKVQTIKVYVAQGPGLDAPNEAMSPMLTLSRRPAP
jgi:hypothetical protein